MDLSRYNPAVNITYFPNTVSSYCWSSTTYADYTGDDWVVGFSSGSDRTYNKSNYYYVRAVRGGQSGSFGNLDHFVISAVPSPQAVGTFFNVTITAADAAGNRVWGFNGSVNLSFKSLFEHTPVPVGGI